MKQYTIKEIKADNKLIIFISSREEYNKLAKEFTFCNYKGNYCYHPTRGTYSPASSRENIGGYNKDCTIIEFNQILLNDNILSRVEIY